MLKRHRNASYSLTQYEDRTNWGLPTGYPMVAPSYAARRSSLAKENGLERKPAAATAEVETDAETEATSAEPGVTKLPMRRARLERVGRAPRASPRIAALRTFAERLEAATRAISGARAGRSFSAASSMAVSTTVVVSLTHDAASPMAAGFQGRVCGQPPALSRHPT